MSSSVSFQCFRQAACLLNTNSSQRVRVFPGHQRAFRAVTGSVKGTDAANMKNSEFDMLQSCIFPDVGAKTRLFLDLLKHLCLTYNSAKVVSDLTIHALQLPVL